MPSVTTIERLVKTAVRIWHPINRMTIPTITNVSQVTPSMVALTTASIASPAIATTPSSRTQV